MSNHFTYEIDERKLRVKLKDLEYPLNEEMWRKFEEKIASQNKQNNSDFLKNVQIPISRNVVLPLVFAGVVLLFSLLLYKFIDIKNQDVKPNTGNIQETTLAPTITNTPSEAITPQPQKVVNAVQKVEPKASTTNKAIPVNSSSSSTNASFTKTPTSANIKQQDTQIVSSKKETKPLNTSPAPLSSGNTTAIKPDSSVKKKTEKRRDANDILETETTPDARPTINLDERESGGRPNK